MIEGCTFEENTGLFGGAVVIDEPNFTESEFTGVNPYYEKRTRPYVIIKENLFHRNQAYISGNAVYIRST